MSLSPVFWPILTSLILLIDGVGHFRGSEAGFQAVAPDWQIARELLGFERGLPVWVHRIMGAFLILSSIHALNALWTKSSANGPFLRFYFRLVTPITLAIIAIGLLLKAKATVF